MSLLLVIGLSRPDPTSSTRPQHTLKEQETLSSLLSKVRFVPLAPIQGYGADWVSGSAIYLYGDQVNDHGPYTIALDGTPRAALNDRSGCGGGYAKECEKLYGLKFFAGNLGAGEHTLRFENGGPTEGDRTFFGAYLSFCPSNPSHAD